MEEAKPTWQDIAIYIKEEGWTDLWGGGGVREMESFRPGYRSAEGTIEHGKRRKIFQPADRQHLLSNYPLFIQTNNCLIPRSVKLCLISLEYVTHL